MHGLTYIYKQCHMFPMFKSGHGLQETGLPQDYKFIINCSTGIDLVGGWTLFPEREFGWNNLQPS